MSIDQRCERMLIAAFGIGDKCQIVSVVRRGFS
jgi:hypothetical protein